MINNDLLGIDWWSQRIRIGSVTFFFFFYKKKSLYGCIWIRIVQSYMQRTFAFSLSVRTAFSPLFH